MLLQKHKKAFKTDVSSFSQNLITYITNSLSFENNVPSCESSFADIPFIVVFNPVKDNKTGIFSKTINPTEFHLPFQDVIVYFLKKLLEVKEF